MTHNLWKGWSNMIQGIPDTNQNQIPRHVLEQNAWILIGRPQRQFFRMILWWNQFIKKSWNFEIHSSGFWLVKNKIPQWKFIEILNINSVSFKFSSFTPNCTVKPMINHANILVHSIYKKNPNLTLKLWNFRF